MRQVMCTAVFAAAVGLAASQSAIGASFQLLTWDDAQATEALPSAQGRKPSATAPAAGDWLTMTADDDLLATGYNPAGAFSHNLVDLTGAGGAGFNQAPSLSGTIQLDFARSDGDDYAVSVRALQYAGMANPMMAMNQFLITPATPPVEHASYTVDGAGNAGTWAASAAGQWAIAYNLDFYLASNVDGDPASGDIDLAFDDAPQRGCLLPRSALNPADLAALALDDPAGYFAGDFAAYLLEQVVPRLPAEATWLLVTQMDKQHPAYAEAGLPIGIGGLIGNTTIAYTTDAVPEPATAGLFALATVGLARRRRHHNARRTSHADR